MGLAHLIVVDVVGGGFGAQQAMISDILLDESVLVMAAHDRVGQVEVFDHRLQFSGVTLSDLTAKDHGEFVGLADGSVGIEQSVT
jgi:hypothetical protein